MEFFVWLFVIVIIGIGIKSAWNFLQDLFGFLGFSSGTSKYLESCGHATDGNGLMLVYYVQEQKLISFNEGSILKNTQIRTVEEKQILKFKLGDIVSVKRQEHTATGDNKIFVKTKNGSGYTMYVSPYSQLWHDLEMHFEIKRG